MVNKCKWRVRKSRIRNHCFDYIQKNSAISIMVSQNILKVREYDVEKN